MLNKRVTTYLPSTHTIIIYGFTFKISPSQHKSKGLNSLFACTDATKIWIIYVYLKGYTYVDEIKKLISSKYTYRVVHQACLLFFFYNNAVIKNLIFGILKCTSKP